MIGIMRGDGWVVQMQPAGGPHALIDFTKVAPEEGANDEEATAALR
eukprot:gene35520-59319_t